MKIEHAAVTHGEEAAKLASPLGLEARPSPLEGGSLFAAGKEADSYPHSRGQKAVREWGGIGAGGLQIMSYGGT